MIDWPNTIESTEFSCHVNMWLRRGAGLLLLWFKKKLLLLGLLGKQDGLNVGQDSTLGDGDA